MHERTYLFSRPQNLQHPTRFLFVGVSSLDFDVQPSLSTLIGIECIIKSPSSPYVLFVVFLDSAAASKAKHSLTSGPVEGIKIVKFADGKQLQVRM